MAQDESGVSGGGGGAAEDHGAVLGGVRGAEGGAPQTYAQVGF